MSILSKDNSGFTLIELLVVIAIIGVLSSVVLASVSSARQSAKEASILSSLRNAQTQATLYYNQNGSYSGLCQNNKIQGILTGLRSISDDGAACWVSTDSYTDYRAELADFDWGIAATYDDIYYAGSPQGVGRVDSSFVGLPGLKTWSEAKTVCLNDGGRLPSPSALLAMYNIESDTPSEFAESHNWTVFESPSDTTLAYRMSMYHGSVYRTEKYRERYVVCSY